jgi:hypothetical protein
MLRDDHTGHEFQHLAWAQRRPALELRAMSLRRVSKEEGKSYARWQESH